jgi:hypothetical protein
VAASPALTSRPAAGTHPGAGGRTRRLAAHPDPGRVATGAAPARRPSTILFASLDGVSCTSLGHCVAVGDFLPVDKDAAAGDPDGDGHATHTLVESSDGDGWRDVASPDEGRGGAALSAVSCPGNDDCTAVGYYVPASFPLSATKAPPSYPLVESDDGHGWAVEPGPHVAPNSVLEGVSCPSVSRCVAVGYTATGPSAAPVESLLVEALEQGSWRVVRLRTPARTSSGLSSVSCIAASSCVAVGDVAPASDPTATRPLVEVLRNTTWSAAALPPAVDGPGILYRVSCVATDRCVAVGTTQATRRSGAALVLASGASGWTANAAALAQRGDISLTAVACGGASGCLATGLGFSSLDSAPRMVVARVGATSWQSLPGSSISGSVESLACLPGSGCVAVGSVPQNSFGNTLALADRFSDGAWTAARTAVP